jgi:hypothetical protein
MWLAFGLALLGGQATAQTRIDERWPLDPAGSVRIVNPVGTIRVRGWDADSLAVSARLARRAGRFYAAGDAHVRTLGVDIAVETGGGAGTGAELDVRVPRGATVWVKSGTASIEVEGVDGTLDLRSEGGTIRVLGTPQDVTAETMDGSVEVAGGTARARVKTVSGDILLRGASQDLGASTLSGRIVVRAAGWQRGGTGVQRGKFESVTGEIRFEGELGRGGVLEVESQSGPIEVRVPASAVADFDVLTIGGTITNHLGDAQPKPRAGGGGKGQELRFSTGPGGAQVTARSFKGAILLEPK